MDTLLNKYMFFIPKKYEFNNEPKLYKDTIVIDDTIIFQLIKIKEHIFDENTIEKKQLNSFNYKAKEDLCLKVNIESGCHISFHPYSMRQAHFLYKQNINLNFLSNIYNFTKEEIVKGYAIKKDYKNKFYPESLEFSTMGFFFFYHKILGKPEFISDEALKLLH